MKYQSELIKEIIDSRGHEKSSLHYESECVESWIEEVKGGYPKLCDYQSEWLNYINENSGIGDFPYHTLVDVTDAVVENVVPYAYKSAILKGQTLVNLLNPVKTQSVNNYVQNFQYGLKELTIIITNKTVDKYPRLSIFDSNTKNWLRNIDPTFTGNKLHYVAKDGEYVHGMVFTTYGSNINIYDYSSLDEYLLQQIMVLEGDYTNVDIPYFTGMQSVKMPVLTTTGKNLFNVETQSTNITIDLDNGLVNLRTNDRNTSDFINVISGKTYVLNKNMTRVALYNNGSFVRSVINTTSIQINSNENQLRFSYDNSLTNIQLEEGSVATSYEPFKSNILSTPEDLALRGIGDVRDELDLLTGEYTQAVYEYTFTGDENWQIRGGGTGGYTYFTFNIGQLPIKYNYNQDTNIPISCDKLPIITHADFDDGLKNVGVNLSYFFRLNFSDCDSNNGATVEDLKAYLKANPTTVQYPISKSIKTVDLTIIDQDGNALSKIKPIEGTMNISTDGTPIKPLLSAEIPVEATTQNLSSFIELEME